MNLEFVLPGSLTMALKGKANPDGFGKEGREEKEGEEGRKKKPTQGSKFAA